ncbi:hypothetical protein HQ489_00735 [Candidatus Woesearchaeota archaeon]|nr:hypothetical protein [Candidatus Woesearchaeota archaeon]
MVNAKYYLVNATKLGTREDNFLLLEERISRTITSQNVYEACATHGVTMPPSNEPYLEGIQIMSKISNVLEELAFYYAHLVEAHRSNGVAVTVASLSFQAPVSVLPVLKDFYYLESLNDGEINDFLNALSTNLKKE